MHPHEISAPSEWICRFAGLIVRGGRVLDLACGDGRHARYLLDRGYRVTALDRDSAALEPLRALPGAEVLVADVEAGAWPLAPGDFDAVIVCNYLHRPLFARLVDALRDGGVLIYETFAVGNERYGRPRNPDFLLRRNELLQAFTPALELVAFEQGLVEAPRPAVIQRICAVKGENRQRLDL